MERASIGNLKGQARAVDNGKVSKGNLKGQARAVENGKVSKGNFKETGLHPWEWNCIHRQFKGASSRH